MKVAQQKNEEKKIILYLYLLHHPDHGYSIAREFLEGRKSGNWNKKRYSDLSNYKVYSSLKQMLAEGMVKTEKPEQKSPESKEKTNIYIPNSFFKTQKETAKKDNANTATLFEAFIEFIPKVSPDRQRCIREISSITKYDDLTVLCYLKKLLRETTELNSLTQPKIGDNEKQLVLGEFDMMRKLSDEIVKTKRSPHLLKPIGRKETYSFFKETLKRKGHSAPPEDEKALAQLFMEAENKIDNDIIDYSYEDRIPTKN